jgi:hypothetical protein
MHALLLLKHYVQQTLPLHSQSDTHLKHLCWHAEAASLVEAGYIYNICVFVLEYVNISPHPKPYTKKYIFQKNNIHIININTTHLVSLVLVVLLQQCYHIISAIRAFFTPKGKTVPTVDAHILNNLSTDLLTNFNTSCTQVGTINKLSSTDDDASTINTKIIRKFQSTKYSCSYGILN